MTVRILVFLSILAVSIPPAAGQSADPPGGCDGARAAKHFDRMDANRDGRVTEDEMMQVRLTLVQRADTNGDGVLSADEFSAAGQGRQGDRAERRFVRLDADNDGAVTMAEIFAVRLAFLRRVDADGDGAMTLTELQAAGPCRGVPRVQ
ncbi:MAG: histidine kinase [Alphaproteobacteria bacterium]|nr:histidine kinase [Alphaproteobacteria bacterium]